MAYPVTEYNAIAKFASFDVVYSPQYKRTPLLTFATGVSANDIRNGKPGTYGIIGGRSSNTTKMMKASLRGSTFRQVPIEIAKFGNAAFIPYRGALPSVANIDIVSSLKFAWTLGDQPAKVMMDDIDAAEGDFRIINLFETSTRNAMGGVQELVQNSLWTGYPTDQTANTWDSYLGIVAALDDGNTYPIFGGANKTVQTELKPAYFSSTATSFTWGLIDNVNKGGTNPLGGAATLGPGVDLVLANASLYYDTIRPMAISDGKDIITGNDIPQNGMVGYIKEAVRYGQTLITFDPYCPAGTSSAKSYLACLTTSSWFFENHPDYDWKFLDWQNQEQITNERAFTSQAQVKGRWICVQPWLNGLYTAVN